MLKHAEEKLKLVQEVATSVTCFNKFLTWTLIQARNRLFGLTYNNLGCIEKQ